MTIRRLIAAAILVLTLIAPARADETATMENVLLVEQLLDVAQTQALLKGGDYRCSQAYGICHPREVDPFAVPFVKTRARNYAAALTVNGLLRLAPVVFRTRRRVIGRLEFTASVGYVGVLFSNANQLRLQRENPTGPTYMECATPQGPCHVAVVPPGVTYNFEGH